MCVGLRLTLSAFRFVLDGLCRHAYNAKKVHEEAMAAAKRSRERLVAALEDRGLSTVGQETELILRLEDALEAEAAAATNRVAKAKDEQRSANAQLWLQRVQEQKEKDAVAKIKAERLQMAHEAEQFRLREEQRREKEQEQNARRDLAGEDKYSQAREQQERAEARRLLAQAFAAQQAKELELHKQMNDGELSRKEQAEKAAKLRNRRRQRAQQIQDNIANQDLALPGRKRGYNFDSNEARTVCEGADRLMIGE